MTSYMDVFVMALKPKKWCQRNSITRLVNGRFEGYSKDVLETESSYR